MVSVPCLSLATRSVRGTIEIAGTLYGVSMRDDGVSQVCSTRQWYAKSMELDLDIRFTICFCVCGDLVLLLHRRKPPHQSRWNGIGGKIEPGESPRAGVRREVAEEAGIDLARAAGVRFAGVVSWRFTDRPTIPPTGMYAFVATFDEDWPVWTGRRPTPEGDVAWQTISWACDPANALVVENIPHFLPAMLRPGTPMLHACTYEDGKLLGVEVQALPAETSL
ncbi:MAG: NUDIX domain-containing protein [Thermomicrobiales bacterium]